MTKDEVLQMCLEYIETNAHERRCVRWAIKEALAQPEQEPVATLDDLEQEIYENTRQFVSRDVMEWMLKRYYTTPPQRTWVGLTDEEIADCAEKMEASDPTDSFWREFFRGLEAKLKEKNT